MPLALFRAAMHVVAVETGAPLRSSALSSLDAGAEEQAAHMLRAVAEALSLGRGEAARKAFTERTKLYIMEHKVQASVLPALSSAARELATLPQRRPSKEDPAAALELPAVED